MIETIIALVSWQCAALWYSPEAQFIALVVVGGWAVDQTQAAIEHRRARNRPQIAKGERGERGR